MDTAIKKKIDNRYIFPDFLAKGMSKVTFRAQNEASLLSQTLLIAGMILMCVYMIMYGGQTFYFKFLLVFNLLCGIVFMGSYLITTYQQYISYMEQMGISTDAEKIRLKSRGNIFKRIRDAWKNKGSKNKIDSKALIALMEKSGTAKEISAEEAEINELMLEKTQKGGHDKWQN
jgi:hypothetical protein